MTTEKQEAIQKLVAISKELRNWIEDESRESSGFLDREEEDKIEIANAIDSLLRLIEQEEKEEKVENKTEPFGYATKDGYWVEAKYLYLRSDKDQFTMPIFSLPPIGVEDKPVAWRDPTNADPGQSITYDPSVAKEWSHIYIQPLYTRPREKQEKLTKVDMSRIRGMAGKIVEKKQSAGVQVFYPDELIVATQNFCIEKWGMMLVPQLHPSFMPIRDTPLGIKMACLDENQAQKNHYSSLDSLRERGGVSPSEAWALLVKQEFHPMDAEVALNSIFTLVSPRARKTR